MKFSIVVWEQKGLINSNKNIDVASKQHNWKLAAIIIITK